MSKKKKDHSVASFQEDWFTKEEFKSWVRKVEKKPQKTYCVLCSKTIDIGNGGSSALESHQKGKTHNELFMKRNENRIGNFFKKKSTDFTSTTDDKVQVVNTYAKPPFVISEDVLDANIVWCLHLVQSHQPCRSCDFLPTVFRRMFKKCSVAQRFNMKKDKVRYMIIYGFYPALKAKQQIKIHASPWFGVSFDESLNRHQQKCQMDVNIRY